VEGANQFHVLKTGSTAAALEAVAAPATSEAPAVLHPLGADVSEGRELRNYC